MADKTTNDIVYAWAALIECREDIDYENDVVRDVILELANPLLTQSLNQHHAQFLIDKIEKGGRE